MMHQVWVALLLCSAHLTLHVIAQEKDSSEEFSKTEAIRVDTCILQPEASGLRETFRAITPAKAGREGLFLRHYMASAKLKYDNNLTIKSYANPTQHISYGVKFYADVPPQSYGFGFFSFAGFYFELTKDGTISAKNIEPDTQAHIRLKNGIEMPTECVDPGKDDSNTINTDDSGWIELTGIKVSPREKRSINDTTCWRLFGIKFTYDHTIAHLDIYINGKKITRISLPKTKEVIPQMEAAPTNAITMTMGKYSCIEVTQGDRPDNYYEDFNLNECQKEYDGEPEQKFIECENKLKNPKTTAPEVSEPLLDMDGLEEIDSF